jgi:hypothetical protein
MPRYDVASAHQIAVRARPEQAYDAFLRLTPAEMPLARLLLAARSLPALVTGRRGLPSRRHEPLLRQMQRSGFVVLAEDSGREIVIGAVGRFWQLSPGLRRDIDPASFASFSGPGLARAAMNVLIEPAEKGSIVRTETRVALPDEASLRTFRRYWRLVGPGSALVRRDILRATRRRAESMVGEGPHVL